jgi:hypothetical protein
MDSNTASVLIDYIEALCENTNHQQMMRHLQTEIGLTEADLDKACRELGEIAGRDFSIL